MTSKKKREKNNSNSGTIVNSPINSNSDINSDSNYWKVENETLTINLQKTKTFYEQKLQTLEDQLEKMQIQTISPLLSYENMSNEELNAALLKIEEQKNQILNVLSNRTKETCVICLVGPRSHVLIPCGHKLFCHSCASSLQKVCPICRAEIQSILKVFG